MYARSHPSRSTDAAAGMSARREQAKALGATAMGAKPAGCLWPNLRSSRAALSNQLSSSTRGGYCVAAIAVDEDQCGTLDKQCDLPSDL
jgi:hypothetical protein